MAGLLKLRRWWYTSAEYAMPGPTPKPVLVKKRDGNPGGRPLKQESKPLPLAPSCPEPVRRNPAAYQHWKFCVATLTAERNKVLTIADGDLLAQYCLLHAEVASLHDEWCAARQDRLLDAMEGVWVADIDMSTTEGRTKARLLMIERKMREGCERQALAALGAARKLYFYCERQLGLDPVSRTKVQVVGEDAAQDDPWADLDLGPASGTQTGS
jgi:phage terminase small subunit